MLLQEGEFSVFGLLTAKCLPVRRRRLSARTAGAASIVVDWRTTRYHPVFRCIEVTALVRSHLAISTVPCEGA